MTTGAGALRFELKNDLAEMSTLAEQLEAVCEQNGIGPEVVSVANLALEEVVTNIISYGYGETPGDHRIRIDLKHDGQELTARIEDEAVAFDPLTKNEVGGLGLQLVKTLM